MKKLLCVLGFVLMFTSQAIADVAVNAANFPDDRFREYVSKFDKDNNGVLSDEEVAAVTQIDVGYANIYSLKGIEYFTALTTLKCHSSKLTALDVSKNTALKYLYCNNNQLTALDVSKNTALTYLNCYYNQLTALDVSGCTALTELYCHDNQLTALDVSGCTALYTLGCYYNQLTVLDVSGCTALANLNCYDNQLTALDVSGCTALTWLWCYNNQLTALDVSGCTALTTLYCDDNQLTALDVSNNTALKELYCNNNQLTALDVSNNTALTRLWCHNNQLTALDVSKHTALTYLKCDGNQLTALDVSNNTALTHLTCYNNQLNALDLSNNIKILSLRCDNQYIEYPAGTILDFTSFLAPANISGLITDSIKAYSSTSSDIETSYNPSTGIAAFASIPAIVQYEYDTGRNNKVLPVTIIITSADSPAITTSSLPEGTIDIAYNFTLSADGTQPITWTITSGDLPDGITLSADGTLSGTPTKSGTYAFTVQAANSGGTDTKGFTLKIEGANVKPTITTQSTDIIAAVGQSYSFQLTAEGTDPIAWSILGKKAPKGITLSASGMLSFNMSKAGKTAFTVKASNAYGYSTKDFTIDSYILPEITTTSIKDTTVGKAYTASFKKKGTEPLTWKFSGKLPEGLSFDASKVMIKGTPQKNGTYTFTLTLSNPAGSDTKSFSFNVNAVLPKISGSMKKGTDGKPYQSVFKASGTLPIIFTYSGDLPKGLSFDSSTENMGIIYGTPEEDCTDREITIIASNMGGETTKTDKLTIKPVAPIITTKSLPNGKTGEYYSADVIASGTKPIIWTADKLPKGLTISKDDTISGIKILGTPEEFGTFTVYLTAKNNAKPVIKGLKIIITSLPVFDDITLQEATAGTSYNQKITSTGTQKITYSITDGKLPNGITLKNDTLKGKPTEAGTFTFTVTAENTAGKTNKDFTLNVNAVAPKISGTLKNGKVGKKYSAKLKVTGTAPITWTVSALPEGIKFSDGEFSGTPAEAFDQEITVTASNSGGNDEQPFSLVITGTAQNTNNNQAGNNKDVNSNATPAQEYEYPAVTVDDEGTQEEAEQDKQPDIIGRIDDYVIVCELPEISVNVSGMHEFDAVLSDDIAEGLKLFWIAGSDEPSDDDNIAEFCDDEGQEIDAVPENRNITVSVWLNEGRVYRPAIAVERK